MSKQEIQFTAMEMANRASDLHLEKTKSSQQPILKLWAFCFDSSFVC